MRSPMYRIIKDEVTEFVGPLMSCHGWLIKKLGEQTTVKQVIGLGYKIESARHVKKFN